MIEVEAKLAIDNAEQMLENLEKCGFVMARQLKEEDRYFDNENHDVRDGGKALRIRTVTDLDSGQKTSVTTFKGPKLKDIVKSRAEYETGVDDAEVYEHILNGLGYHGVSPRVVKVRRELELDSMTACLDRIEGLGNFLELEIVAEDDGDLQAVNRTLKMQLDKLGLNIEDAIGDSYLEMLMSRYPDR